MKISEIRTECSKERLSTTGIYIKRVEGDDLWVE
jgi:hypothetical protein